MTDIVEWLRDRSLGNTWLNRCAEAADEIERLRELLREVLRPMMLEQQFLMLDWKERVREALGDE